jgi:hypothetical protein
MTTNTADSTTSKVAAAGQPQSNQTQQHSQQQQQQQPLKTPSKRFKSSRHLILQRRTRSRKRRIISSAAEADTKSSEPRCDSPSHKPFDGSSSAHDLDETPPDTEGDIGMSADEIFPNNVDETIQEPSVELSEREQDVNDFEDKGEGSVIGDANRASRPTSSASTVSEYGPDGRKLTELERIYLKRLACRTDWDLALLFELKDHLKRRWVQFSSQHDANEEQEENCRWETSDVSVRPEDYDVLGSTVSTKKLQNLQVPSPSPSTIAPSPSPSVIAGQTITAAAALTPISIASSNNMQAHIITRSSSSITQIVKPNIIRPFYPFGNYPQQVPLQHYPYMRNLPPSIPSTKQPNGAKQFITEAFSLHAAELNTRASLTKEKSIVSQISHSSSSETLMTLPIVHRSVSLTSSSSHQNVLATHSSLKDLASTGSSSKHLVSEAPHPSSIHDVNSQNNFLNPHRSPVKSKSRPSSSTETLEEAYNESVEGNNTMDHQLEAHLSSVLPPLNNQGCVMSSALANGYSNFMRKKYEVRDIATPDTDDEFHHHQHQQQQQPIKREVSPQPHQQQQSTVVIKNLKEKLGGSNVGKDKDTYFLKVRKKQ